MHALTVLHKVGADDEEVQCAAVLHDVIEDCTGKTIYIGGVAKAISFAMLLEEGMSEQVVDTVRRLTKMPGQTYEEYQEGVLGSVKAMLVKKEDLRTNSDLRRLKSRGGQDFATHIITNIVKKIYGDDANVFVTFDEFSS